MDSYFFGLFDTLKMFFCCRVDTVALASTVSFDELTPYLPDRFTLFRTGGSCQAINGRSVNVGWV